MGPVQRLDQQKEIFEAARRIRAITGIDHGEIRIVIHQGEVQDVLETKRYRDNAER